MSLMLVMVAFFVFIIRIVMTRDLEKIGTLTARDHDEYATLIRTAAKILNAVGAVLLITALVLYFVK